MTISRSDRLRAQLRAQLRQYLQAEASRPEGAPSSTADPSARAFSSPRLHALQAQGGVDEAELTTALLQDLLLPTLDAGMEDDPRFQRALAEMVALLRADPESWALCQRALAES